MSLMFYALSLMASGCGTTTSEPPTTTPEAEVAEVLGPVVPAGERAPSRAYFGLELGAADQAAIDAWVAANGLSCSTTPAPARTDVLTRCDGNDLSGAWLAERGLGGRLVQVFLSRGETTALHFLATSRRYSVPRTAAADYDASVAAVAARLGAPAEARPASSLQNFDDRFIRLASRWSYADLAVEVTLMRTGQDYLVVNERWSVPYLAESSEDRAGGGHFGAKTATAALDGAVQRGEGSLPIGEVHARVAELEGQQVRVTGKVVKASSGIFGTNWYHLQDGTGDAEAETHDLTVTSDAEVAAGDLVTFEGPLTKDKDLGFGYFYAAIIEGARQVE